MRVEVAAPGATSFRRSRLTIQEAERIITMVLENRNTARVDIVVETRPHASSAERLHAQRESDEALDKLMKYVYSFVDEESTP